MFSFIAPFQLLALLGIIFGKEAELCMGSTRTKLTVSPTETLMTAGSKTILPSSPALSILTS